MHYDDDDDDDDDEDDDDDDDDDDNDDVDDDEDDDDLFTRTSSAGHLAVLPTVTHSLHFQFTARCNRRCLLIAIVTPV